MSEMTFENLDYGAYSIEAERSQVIQEAFKYASAEFNKLYVQKVRLPDGKGNVIYLLSNSFDGCLDMLKNQNFIIPPLYRRIFYPVYYNGRFMNKVMRMVLTREKPNRDRQIKNTTKFIPFSTRRLPDKLMDNTFFLCGDIYSKMADIMARYPIKRNYTEFFESFNNIIESMTPPRNGEEAKGNNCRLLIIDCNAFSFNISANINENKTNPLYLFYLKYLRDHTLVDSGLNMDILICQNNLFMKFNPSKCDRKQFSIFKRALFRMMNANLDNYTDQLSNEDKTELGLISTDRVISNTIANTVAPYTKMTSVSTQTAVIDAVEKRLHDKSAELVAKDQATKEIQQHVATVSGAKVPDFKPSNASIRSGLIDRNLNKNPLSNSDLDFFNKVINNYTPLSVATNQYVDNDDETQLPDDYESDLENDVHEILTDDEQIAAEVVDEIQDNIAPLKNLKTAPVNSARDQKLREEQKKIIVQNETIEEILSRDTNNVPIESEDKSAVLHTSNQNMKKVTFANFDKTYIDQLFTKDLISCFDMLKDKNAPFYITNVEINDTSDQLNYKETWTVSLKDELGKKHTIKVDIPKFINDRFMLINGTRFMILKQNFYNPLVKDTPDTVIMTTNFNKVTIDRTSSKSFSSVERIFSLLKKTGDTKMFTAGDSSQPNTKFISSLEYDEISRRIFKFTSDHCELYFSRQYLKESMSKEIEAAKPKEVEFYIGHEGDTPILIDENTGLDRNGRTIIDIIYNNLPEDYQMIYDKETKPPKQSMYVEAKLAGQMMPMIATLIVWNGIRKTLDEIGVPWEFHPNAKRLPEKAGYKTIKFLDGILEYKAELYAELILNGITGMKPDKFAFDSFESEEGYSEYMRAQFGTYAGISRLHIFNEFLVDPITESVCRDLMLPTTPTGLLIHAAKLLSDNSYVSKASDKSFRIRSVEMIPGILYSCIANQYASYLNSGGKIPMTLRQNAVLSALMAEKTVEPYSTLNPVVEVGKMSTISTKGYRGSNSEMAYKNEEKRSYDSSAIGKLAMSTSARNALAE